MSGFARREMGDGMVALVATGLESDGFLAAFLERGGGVSRDPFGSLNGAYTVGDERVAVDENRRRAAAAFGIDRFCVPGLIHGTKVAAVGPARASDGFDGPAERLADADGTTTRSVGLGLGAYSGDCVIAILAHPGEGRVALVHAGWRGLAAGVLAAAVGRFDDARDLRVALGPAIGMCHYEVGSDVVLAVATGSAAGVVAERRNGRHYLNLIETTRAALRSVGVRRVHDTGLCTACEEDRLFSFRRDGTTGRHLALGMRLPS